jgi:hypothetical protein
VKEANIDSALWGAAKIAEILPDGLLPRVLTRLLPVFGRRRRHHSVTKGARMLRGTKHREGDDLDVDVGG